MSPPTQSPRGRRKQGQACVPAAGPHPSATGGRPPAPWCIIPARQALPLRWALPTSLAGTYTERLLKSVQQCARRGARVTAGLIAELESWLDGVPQRTADAALALECLAWSYLLPRLARVLPAAPWCAVLDCLMRRGAEHRGTTAWQDPLGFQLLHGELPLTLGYLFPESQASDELLLRGGETLRSGVHEFVDASGLPQQRFLPVLRGLLACWIRCGYIARQAARSWLNPPAQARLAGALRGALQLTRPNGSAALGDQLDEGFAPDLFDAALELVGDADTVAIANRVLRWRPPRAEDATEEALWPEPAGHSEWAEMAVLRAGWSRDAANLIVAYNDRGLRTECHNGGEMIWSGDWNPALSVNGRPAEPTAPWQEVCWVSGDDADYLELELLLAGGWQLQRQVLLARTDNFLYLADALVGPQAAAIEYRSVLPLASRTKFRPAAETREGGLIGKQWRAAVFPLALPEWQATPAAGQLHATAAGLELRWSGYTQRLYAPLFFDLDRSRQDQPFTWRQLTVAERLQILPPSVAVGYRVQIGEAQWLFYRSLAPSASRTVLGQNIAYESYVGRFDCDGEVDQLVAVDS